MGRKITVTADVELPRIPLFLKYGGGTLDIADVEDGSLRALADEWTKTLLDTAAKRRSQRASENKN